ncbi:MAG: hypothetical protein C0521_15105, partial [Xanthomonas sp.]|nr:hypothetical protein [Xanthomonas sp.]
YQDYQRQVGEYDQLMLQVAQDAFARFERKLTDHAEPGRQLQNTRALFDLWIDAAEEAYAQVAMSTDFRHAFGGLANAQARLRLGVQREVEQVCSQFGMPTRTEVDSAHRKIVELERALRKLTRVQAAPGRRAQARATTPAETPVVAEVSRPTEPAAAKPKAAKKRVPARRTSAAKPKVAPKQRPAAKKKAAKKPARRTVAAAAPAASKRERVVATTRVVAKKPAKAKKAATKVVSKASVEKATRKATAPATKPTSAKPAAVVSMKDWVARNATRSGAAGVPEAGKKTKRGKGK